MNSQLCQAKSEVHIRLANSQAIWKKFAQLVNSLTIQRNKQQLQCDICGEVIRLLLKYCIYCVSAPSLQRVYWLSDSLSCFISLTSKFPDLPKKQTHTFTNSFEYIHLKHPENIFCVILTLVGSPILTPALSLILILAPLTTRQFSVTSRSSPAAMCRGVR